MLLLRDCNGFSNGSCWVAGSKAAMFLRRCSFFINKAYVSTVGSGGGSTTNLGYLGFDG